MTILTLQPDGTAGIDTLLNFAAPTFNYGVALLYPVGAISTNEPRRALIKIDISSLPAGATLNSAILTLYCEAEATTTDRTIGVHRALTQWFEGVKDAAAPDASQDGSTWNLRNANGSVAWGAAGGQSGVDYTATATASVVITAPATAYDFNVLADVQAWHEASAVNHGWFVINTQEMTSNTRKTIASSDNATAGNRPKLVIDYTEAAADGGGARIIEIGGNFGVEMFQTGGAGLVVI